jgi:hypothetical protein
MIADKNEIKSRLLQMTPDDFIYNWNKFAEDNRWERIDFNNDTFLNGLNRAELMGIVKSKRYRYGDDYVYIKDNGEATSFNSLGDMDGPIDIDQLVDYVIENEIEV